VEAVVTIEQTHLLAVLAVEAAQEMQQVQQQVEQVIAVLTLLLKVTQVAMVLPMQAHQILVAQVVVAVVLQQSVAQLY
jgi:hypothetical protein